MLYFISNSDTTLSGEITWFWHPKEKVIKGYGHLLSNQISYFDYSTKFKDSLTMVNTIEGYNSEDVRIPIYETIQFIGSNTYRWTMYEKIMNKLEPQMSIIFNRKN